MHATQKRKTVCRSAIKLLDNIVEQNSGGQGDPSLITTHKLGRTMVRHLRNCVSDERTACHRPIRRVFYRVRFINLPPPLAAVGSWYAWGTGLGYGPVVN